MVKLLNNFSQKHNIFVEIQPVKVYYIYYIRESNLKSGLCQTRFFNRDWERKISPFGPANKMVTENLYLKSRCRDPDQEWIIINPTNETGSGPYLVPGRDKTFHFVSS